MLKSPCRPTPPAPSLIQFQNSVMASMPPGCSMNSSASWFSLQAASSTSRGATRRSTSVRCAISSSYSLLMSTGPPVQVGIEPNARPICTRASQRDSERCSGNHYPSDRADPPTHRARRRHVG